MFRYFFEQFSDSSFIVETKTKEKGRNKIAILNKNGDLVPLVFVVQ